ncbi:MAG: D-tyrosyl-tRNA(Tyr) deacylase [Clostridiales bacterium]|nr:D-tyrosyl-tRNA(Tyr) deacylase [Clostridiales bacterium]
MKVVIQRVSNASVTVENEVVGEIGQGYLIFLGVGPNDTIKDCERLVDKISGLRIFSDDNDKINLSIKDVQGEILVVSQFTLYADCRKGNRPSFTKAAKPDHAEKLYEAFVDLCKSRITLNTEKGVFGASMKVNLLNDGPFTVEIESINGVIV